MNIDFAEAATRFPPRLAGPDLQRGGDPERLPPGVSHALNILGELASGPFTSETHNANDPTVFPAVGQYGSIYFTDPDGNNTSLDYTGLQPINDTTPATTYTFNDFADDQSFTAQDGPTVLTFNTIQFVNTPVHRAANLRDDECRQQSEHRLQHALGRGPGRMRV